MMSSRDNDFYAMSMAVGKALRPYEEPLKIKHVRAAIICTHKTHGAESIWAAILRQPLMENRFVAWKFCHLLQKVLREGHSRCLPDSQRHKKMMLEVGKLWGHLTDGFGICVQSYTKLLVYKLTFHDHYPRIPGNLVFSFTELEQIYESDINIFFELCLEIFEYLDGIDELQSKIFTSLNTFRMSSMTPQGQCRLAPIIPLIQDSEPLYNCAAACMFKLYTHLPNDMLLGHRERFRSMFSKLKTFYDNVRPLQYFADLVQVPILPETAPTFSSKVDFDCYVVPSASDISSASAVDFSESEPEANIVVDNLVDLSIPENYNMNSENLNSFVGDNLVEIRKMNTNPFL